MEIRINTDQPLTATEESVLRLLLGETKPAAPAAKPAPATKPGPKPKAAAKPEPEPEPEDTTEEGPAESEDEDLVGAATFTRDDAIKLATSLVAEGKPAVVKAALKAAGAARVSELTDAQVPKFMEAASI